MALPLSSWLKKQEREEKIRVHMDEPDCVQRLANNFALLLKKLCQAKNPVILCIGTDRSTGDSLGPLVGSKLGERFFPAPVYGSLAEPVHAVNLPDYLNLIQHNHPHPFLIAVDASLGNVDSVGYINLAPGAIKPGAGVNKNLPEVGDIHFTGIVNVAGFLEFLVLQNTRLHTVMKMADIIAAAIAEGFRLAKNPAFWRDKHLF